MLRPKRNKTLRHTNSIKFNMANLSISAVEVAHDAEKPVSSPSKPFWNSSHNLCSIENTSGLAKSRNSSCRSTPSPRRSKMEVKASHLIG